MSQQITIPGGTAVIRDGLVTVRQRRIIQVASLAASSVLRKVEDISGGKRADESDADFEGRSGDALSRVSLTVQEARNLLDMQDAAIVAFLESWSLPDPLPTIETIQTLTSEVYDALSEATKGRTVAALRVIDFSPTPELDKSVPTGDSGSSTGPSTADPESTPTPTSSNSGKGTATASSTPA